MKKYKKFLISLLMLSPLLMANAPVPQVNVDKYDAFTCTFKSKTEEVDSDSNPYYSYKYDINNTGTGYLKSVSISYPNKKGSAYLYKSHGLFGDELIAPGKADVLSFGTTLEYDYSTEPFTYSGNAYQRFVADAFTSERKEIRVESYYGSYNYYVSFDSNVNVTRNNRDYDYGIIISITYKGTTYVTHHELKSNNEFFLCNSSEELDLSQLTINEMIMTYSDAYKSAIGVVFTVIVVILAIGGVFLAGGVIFVCIFFPIRAYKKKKRLAEQQSSN